MPLIKEYLDNHGIYPEPFKAFEKDLRKEFKKKKDLINLTRIRQATGKHPDLIKKYLSAMVELHRIRRCDAYFLGCSQTELIMVDFGFGSMAVCPTCNHEIVLPSKGGPVICDCGVQYVERAPSKWTYEPRVKYLGDGTWRLESFSVPGKFYTVKPFARNCSCCHHHYRGAYCKHMKKVASLIASTVFSVIDVFNSKSNEALAVLAAVLRRWFDPRKYLRSITYRELRNEIEKISGLKLTTHQIASVVSKFEKKRVLKRIRLPLPCLERKVLITVDQCVLQQLLDYETQKSEDLYSHCFNVEFPVEKPFLRLDIVDNADVVLPETEYTMNINVNYSLPKPTDIRIEIQDVESHVVASSLIVHLNGEDVASFSLTAKPLGKKVWQPRVDLYRLDEKNEWCHADYYLGNCVYSPTIEINESKRGVYEVESFSEPGKFYEVNLKQNWCSCPDHLYNSSHCKHLKAVERINDSFHSNSASP
jgi:predicted nucleic acid-binding Zn finger protein